MTKSIMQFQRDLASKVQWPASFCSFLARCVSHSGAELVEPRGRQDGYSYGVGVCQS